MRPVHVIVTEDSRHADAWAAAFGANIELYRFNSNAEAFERLIAASSPVHLLVITPSQNPMFNLKTEELVRRLVNSPVGAVPMLAGLGVVVIGEKVDETPRVVNCSTIESAIRFVTFGEREPQQSTIGTAADQYYEHTANPATAPVTDTGIDLRSASGMANDAIELAQSAAGRQGAEGFADSLISAVWNQGPLREHGSRQGSRLTPMDVQDDSGPGFAEGSGSDDDFLGGGPGHANVHAHPRAGAPTGTRVRMPRSAARFGNNVGRVGAQKAALFTHSRAMNESGIPVQGVHAAPASGPTADESLASGHSDPLLQPARQIMLHRRGVRNDGTRGGHPASRHVVRSGRSAPLPGRSAAAPVPAPDVPAVAGQVAQLVYGGAAQADPVLGWSARVQDELAAQQMTMTSPGPSGGVVSTPVAGVPVVAPHLPAVPQMAAPSTTSARYSTSAAPARPAVAPARTAAASVQPMAAPIAVGQASVLNDNFSAPAALLEREAAEGVSFG